MVLIALIALSRKFVILDSNASPAKIAALASATLALGATYWRDALFISELGSLPENVTWLSPEGEYQKWNGTAWVKDTEAEKLFRIREAEETKNSLMQVASEHIAPLQDAVDLEIATEEETSLLEAWKKYRVLLIWRGILA